MSIFYAHLLPMCRYLAIPSNQDNITELLLLQVALHFPEGLLCMVNSLVEFLRATWIHVTVGWQGVAGPWQSVNHKRSSMLVRCDQVLTPSQLLESDTSKSMHPFPTLITVSTRWKNPTALREKWKKQSYLSTDSEHLL